MKRLVVLRRISQTLFLALFVYILWSTTHPLKGALPPGTFFKIDPLVMIVTAVSERVILGGMLVSFLMLIVTAVIGRFFCGWICPLGATMDLIRSSWKKRAMENDIINNKRKSIKFFLLGMIIFASFFGVQTAWALDPMVLMARFVSLNLIPAVTSALNLLFMLLVRDLGMYGPVQDVYRALKGSILGINVYYFAHSWVILAFFLGVCALTLLSSRFWCRSICPLGAIYALAGRYSSLRRTVKDCNRCGRCRNSCRMGAIRGDNSYSQGECILCMDCVYDCHLHSTAFRWGGRSGCKLPDGRQVSTNSGITRRQFIMLTASSAGLLGFKFPWDKTAPRSAIIRPPAALKEGEFINRCIRCGNCMKVCVTNGLQPVMLEAGIDGIWTPQLVPEIGYCEYQCTLCGNTCPTGAIPPLSIERKKKVKLGLAVIDRETCLPYIKGTECIVCEEHCPVPNKAIKLVMEAGAGGAFVAKPVIDKELCVGCAICQTKCPVRPRAVRVVDTGSDRT